MAEIPQKLFFRIGEVCDLIQVQPHVLRYWETEFPTLAPQKNRAGQRVYRRKDVEMVMRIRDLLYVEKFTIAGARKRLLEEVKKGGAPKLRSTGRDRGTQVEGDKNLELSSDLPAEVLADESVEIVDEPAPPVLATPPSDVASLPSPPFSTSEPIQQHATLSPRSQRALRVIKHELEGLLTLLKSDATLNRSI